MGLMAPMWCGPQARPQQFAASAAGSRGRKLTWGDGHCVVRPAGQRPHIPALEDLHLGGHLFLLPHALPDLAQIVLAPGEHLPRPADACCMPFAKAERSPPAHNLQVQRGLSWQLAGLRQGLEDDNLQRDAHGGHVSACSCSGWTGKPAQQQAEQVAGSMTGASCRMARSCFKGCIPGMQAWGLAAA